jgi:hypothetical protein
LSRIQTNGIANGSKIYFQLFSGRNDNFDAPVIIFGLITTRGNDNPFSMKSQTAGLERFTELAKEAREHQFEVDRITFEQMNLAFAMSKQILAAAFPGVKFTENKVISIIRPTDYSKSANDTVVALNAAGISPGEIQVDSNRLVITLIE